MTTHAERYARDGFTTIPGLIAPDMVAQLKTTCRDLLATHAAHATVLLGASVLSPPLPRARHRGYVSNPEPQRDSNA